MKRHIIIFLLLITFKSWSQDSDSKPRIQVIGYIKNSSILIRWSPTNSISWQRANSIGYSVYRSTVLRNNNVIENPDTLFVGIFKAMPIEKWEQYSDSSLFAVAAESIYGEGFEITTQSDNFFDLVNKSREQESRFTFGMLCADQSFTVACIMGLGFVDSTVKSNEAYLYKIVNNYKDSLGYQETGYVMVDFSYGNFLPKPFGISYFDDNGRVTINIPYEPFKGIYNNFQLEKSEDGMNFKVVKDKSFYSLSTTPDDPKYTTYNDSIGIQASTLFYRLKGRTPFDTYGPYSDTLEVKVMPSLSGVPWIKDIKELSNNNLSISWGFDNSKVDNLNGFIVYSSNKYEGPYKEYLNNTIDSNLRSTLIPVPDGYSYFKVGALDQYSRTYLSSPKLYQALDSIPPAKPEGLIGSIDTNGRVNLNWHYATEKDLLGYKVLYSTSSDGEYALLNRGFIYDSTFVSRFSTDVLASDIYFKVQAVDLRYNSSILADPIKLVKPDKMPPSRPIILFEKDSLNIKLIKILPSHSVDISHHILYVNKGHNNDQQTRIYQGNISKDTVILLDNMDEGFEVYCTAVDKSGMESVSNSLLSITSRALNKSNLTFKSEISVDDVAIKIFWDPSLIKNKILIYRKEEGKGFSLIETIDSQVGFFIDKNLLYDLQYEYKLIGQNKDDVFFTEIVNCVLR